MEVQLTLAPFANTAYSFEAFTTNFGLWRQNLYVALDEAETAVARLVNQQRSFRRVLVAVYSEVSLLFHLFFLMHRLTSMP